MQLRQCFNPPRSAKSGCNICRQWWKTGVEVLGKLLQLEKQRMHLRHLRTTVLKVIQNVSVQTGRAYQEEMEEPELWIECSMCEQWLNATCEKLTCLPPPETNYICLQCQK